MSDLISRQAVLDYPIRLDHYDEEHGNRVFVLGIESVMEYVESIPSETCDDCIWHTCNYNKIDWDGEDGYISKRNVMEVVDRPIVPTGDAVYDNAREDERASIKDGLSFLPSAEPKTGKWIQRDMYADRFCSECNYAVWDSEAEEYNFCPNCGARMGGNEE